uniref:Uncharacterized protein n=1 Tax=Arundo donax TaxID=35708 RepID=A0A0A8Z9C7_ARUDO
MSRSPTIILKASVSLYCF